MTSPASVLARAATRIPLLWSGGSWSQDYGFPGGPSTPSLGLRSCALWVGVHSRGSSVPAHGTQCAHTATCSWCWCHRAAGCPVPGIGTGDLLREAARTALSSAFRARGVKIPCPEPACFVMTVAVMEEVLPCTSSKKQTTRAICSRDSREQPAEKAAGGTAHRASQTPWGQSGRGCS